MGLQDEINRVGVTFSFCRPHQKPGGGNREKHELLHTTYAYAYLRIVAITWNSVNPKIISTSSALGFVGVALEEEFGPDGVVLQDICPFQS